MNNAIKIIGISVLLLGVLGFLGSNLGVGLPYLNAEQIELFVILVFVGIILTIVGVVFE